MMRVPEVVRAKAIATGADDWLAGLPDLAAALSDRWELTIGEPFPDATEALVVPATRADGTAAVLKLLVPRDDAARHEVTTLRLAAGDGCVQLLESDPGHGAMLIERLGPSMHDLRTPFEQRQAILAGLARRVWRPAHDAGLPTGADKGRWLIDHIVRTWNELDRPCSERALDDAVACAERRIAAHDDERAVLVHGDVHQWNALRTLDGTGWRLVDPDGLLAEPEYDLGVLMREDPVELLGSSDPDERARSLAIRTGLDPVAIWEWGVVERVSTGLLCTRIGLQPVGSEMLRAADAVAP